MQRTKEDIWEQIIIDGSTEFSGPVLTRAQAKAGVVHDSRPEPDPEPFSNLDCSLFEGAQKAHKSLASSSGLRMRLTSGLPDIKEKKEKGLSKNMW